MLAGRVCMVTGAARGIGKGVADLYLSRGARVATVDLNGVPESLRHANQLHLQADVSDRKAITAAFNRCKQELGVPDILVVNAGGAWRRGPLAEVEGDADWAKSRYTIDVNLYGNIHVSQLMAAAMKARAEAGGAPAIGTANGKICCISSIMSLFASEGRIEYATCKAAINHFVFNLAHELGKYRVNVNAVLPGHIDTPGERMNLTEEQLQQGAYGIPWKRLGNVNDVANAVAFLCSAEADYITGSTIIVDGGFMANLRLPGWVNL